MPPPCPYCSVAANQVLWESEHVVAHHAPSPRAQGHVVVSVKRHVAHYFEASAIERADLWRGVDAVKRLLEVDDPTSTCGVQFDDSTPGTEHLHVNVMPLGPEHHHSSRTQLTTGADKPLGSHLFRDLERAVRVDIAVAFVFAAGLQTGVLSRLKDLLEREGSRIRLLTGDYQGVTEPAALRLLLTLKEHAQELPGAVDLRVFETARTQSSFHPKAYLLYADEAGRPLAIYVGSSNLSKVALFQGAEWNLRLADAESSELARREFDALFAHGATQPLTHAWVDAYEQRRPVALATPGPDVAVAEDLPLPVPEPSPVQVDALEALEATREAGNRAGLVTLATGLGKTWLSAFDSTKERGFERVLFVAHRAEILGQAMATFARIRPDASVGLYTGTDKTFDATLLFASIQTLSQEQHLTRFSPTHFDYVVVDEFHHAAATTYRRVIDYFQPKFLLALTATPERTDGGDLLALCDENTVFDCGLARGIRQQLLCPFHYFGVPDMVEYDQIPWRSRRFDEEALTTAVATTVRAQNALEQLQSRGGTRTLAFCVSQRHADFMREYFTAHSQLRCASVHSGPSSDSRSRALEQLRDGTLDVLFSVDMFNEGLDVPSIDTVLMLRPTESKIIWLQQLGRGLRRHEGKSHLRVIDYIGNHRSFLDKAETLLDALEVRVTAAQQLARMLRESNYTLPDGCEVTYTLEAQEILAKLCVLSREGETLREWYMAFRERAERRPTAREALHSVGNVHEVRGDYGSWFEFVDQMGDLNEAEQETFKHNRDFLHELETAGPKRADDVLLIDALRVAERLPGAIALKDLAALYHRRASRSAKLQGEVSRGAPDDPALRAALRQGPVTAWCDRKDSRGLPFFRLEGDTLRSSEAIVGTPASLGSLVAELVEWRIAEHLARRPHEAVLKVIKDARGEPVLKLDRKKYDLPEQDVLVAADSASYQAQYGKHLVTVARRTDDGPNELGSLLKGWFGSDAGANRSHVVIQRENQGRVTWEPKLKQVVDVNGAALDARFEVEDFEGEPTIVFHSRGAGRNNDYSAALELILRRLGQASVKILGIAVESQQTRTLPLEKRQLSLKEAQYPIDLQSVPDIEQLRLEIGRAGAALRESGAKGSGNANKKLRIWLSESVDAQTLARE